MMDFVVEWGTYDEKGNLTGVYEQLFKGYDTIQEVENDWKEIHIGNNSDVTLKGEYFDHTIMESF